MGTTLVNKQYGKWNAILASNNDAKRVFYQNHAKIFPEQLSDWITALQQVILYNVFVPVRLDIDITNYCPNDCIMCFAKELRERHKTFIPFVKLIKIFKDFSRLGGKSVRLTGGGEPLSHPNIADIIKVLAGLKLKITIETNGDLIGPEIADVIAKYVHHFRVSVNSADNSTRKLVHKPHVSEFTYDGLIEKIKLVRQKSIDFNREEELFIGATFVILPENYLSTGQFVTQMCDIGVNWVALRKNIYREVYSNNPNIISFAEDEVRRLKENLKSNSKDFTIEEQYGVSFNPKEDFDECWISHVRSIVLANSSLHLCCLARNGVMLQANIGGLPDTENPIKDLFINNKGLVEKFRAYVPKNCQFCIDKDNNISFSNVISLLKTSKDFEFTKANVVLSDKNYINPIDHQIIEVGLNKDKYQIFKNGTMVDLSG